VGVSKYFRGNKDRDWWDLASDRDVDELANVLGEKRFGFDEIKVLKTRQETTHRAIVDTFRNWLIRSTNENDIVYFHYSGHGSQAPDTDTPDNPIVGDEMDGLDETLVPSDYVSQDDPRKDIRDDEVGILLAELQKKKPAQVFLTFDSCHAGSITRGRLIVRGKNWTGPRPVVKPGPHPVKTTGGFLTLEQADSHGYVVLSATKAEELAVQIPNNKGEQMGLLTYALINALHRVGEKTTYRDIFEIVNNFVYSQPTRQNPQLEGADIDNIFLTKVANPPPRFFTVRVEPSGTLTLAAGALQGVTEGSTFALYAAGNGDPKTEAPIAQARVKTVDYTHAQLDIGTAADHGALDRGRLQSGRAIEISHNYGDNRLRLNIDLLRGHPRRQEIVKTLQNLSLATIVTNGWDVRICTVSCPQDSPSVVGQGTGLVLQRADGHTIAQLPEDDQLAAAIRRVLERQSRWQFVNALDNKDSNMRIQMRLVPVEVESKTTCGDPTRVVRDRPPSTLLSAGVPRLSVCDYVMLELKYSRLGSGPPYQAWVSVLDLQNDGSVSPLWPAPSRQADDNRLPDDDQWHRVPFPNVMQIERPLGPEVFKAIVTSEPTDFGPVADATLKRGLRSPEEEKAMQSPLGQLLRAAVMGQRAKNSGLNPTDWATVSVHLEVTEKK
jgi:hypothetical protein